MRLIDLLRDRKIGPIPVWMMRQAGRYLPEYRDVRARAGSFLDLCYNPELACEVTLQPIRRYGFDAAILFSDILVIPDALGQKVWFVEGEGPRLDPIANRADLDRLNPGKVMAHLQPVLETVRLLRERLPEETALIGFCGAPWTVATYMVAGRGTPDQAPARLWAYGDPEGFAQLIDRLVEASIVYLNAQVKAGADVLQIFDTWAGILPEAEFQRWCVEPLARIVHGVKAEHPKVPIIGFPRGAGPSYRRVVDTCGFDGIGIDTGLSLSFARDHLQPHAVVQGNLDPLVLVAGGQALDAAVDRILRELGAGPFIFNLGHGIVPQTPPEHVAQVIARIRNWGT